MLSGTPTAAGTASFTVNVTDTAGATLSKNYTLTVNPSLSSIAPPALAGRHGGDGDQPDHHGVGRHHALHHLNFTAFSAGGHGTDGRQLTRTVGRER